MLLYITFIVISINIYYMEINYSNQWGIILTKMTMIFALYEFLTSRINKLTRILNLPKYKSLISLLKNI